MAKAWAGRQVRSRIPDPIRYIRHTLNKTMTTLCLSQLHHTLIRSSAGPRTAVRVFSSSTSSLYSRAKNFSANAPTTTPGSGTTNPWKKTSNNNSSPYVPPPNSVLAYVGPYAASLRQCKSVAFVFGACGCIAVPATLFLGNTEHLLAIMGNYTFVCLFYFNQFSKYYTEEVTCVRQGAESRNCRPGIAFLTVSVPVSNGSEVRR